VCSTYTYLYIIYLCIGKFFSLSYIKPYLYIIYLRIILNRCRSPRVCGVHIMCVCVCCCVRSVFVIEESDTEGQTLCAYTLMSLNDARERNRRARPAASRMTWTRYNIFSSVQVHVYCIPYLFVPIYLYLRNASMYANIILFSTPIARADVPIVTVRFIVVKIGTKRRRFFVRWSLSRIPIYLHSAVYVFNTHIRIRSFVVNLRVFARLRR